VGISVRRVEEERGIERDRFLNKNNIN